MDLSMLKHNLAQLEVLVNEAEVEISLVPIKLIQANKKFLKQLEVFSQFIDCLSHDYCFKLWVSETEDLLMHSTDLIRQYGRKYISESVLIDEHKRLAMHIQDLTGCIYEGHWEYGLSQEADQQFDDLTELCRRLWEKESKAWIKLAKAWGKIKTE